MSIIVAKVKNEDDADFIVQFIRRFKGEVKLLSEKLTTSEDKWMIKKIDEGMKEKGEIPIEEILAKLRK